MVNSLRDMQARMQQWYAEKPTYDFSDELNFNQDDVVIFQFVSSGDDGDKYIKVYRSHIIPMQSEKSGKRYNRAVYCPIKSGEGTECALCAQGHQEVKERMSMWLAVHNHLHAQMVPEKQFPQVQHESRIFFNEEVRGFKLWHTSAWKDSPLADIFKLNELYKGLHNFTAQIQRVGSSTNTRYKLYAIPNSAMLSKETYELAAENCTPIPTLLQEQASVPIQVNPTQQTQQQQSSQPSPPPSPTFGSVVAPLSIPGVPSSTPNLNIPTLSGEQATETEESVQEPTTEVAKDTAGSPQEPADDSKRPLKKMF